MPFRTAKFMGNLSPSCMAELRALGNMRAILSLFKGTDCDS